MADWEINKPLGKCFGTQHVIEPEEEYYATLVETEQGLQRRDFCIEYWQREKPTVYCHWKTKQPNPEQKKRRFFVDDDMLLSFFERLATEIDQEKINFRFVLTLILMRKRILKYDSSRTEDGNEIWRVRVVREKDFVDVLNPNLTEEQIEQLSSQVGEILQVDL